MRGTVHWVVAKDAAQMCTVVCCIVFANVDNTNLFCLRKRHGSLPDPQTRNDGICVLRKCKSLQNRIYVCTLLECMNDLNSRVGNCSGGIHLVKDTI